MMAHPSLAKIKKFQPRLELFYFIFVVAGCNGTLSSGAEELLRILVSEILASCWQRAERENGLLTWVIFASFLHS